MKINDEAHARLAPLILAGQATDKQLQDAGFAPEDVFRIKSEADFNTRAVVPPVDYEVKQLGERSFRLPLTNERVDHAGDLLKANWDMRVFKANPMGLWMHRTVDPIGTWSDVKKEDVKGLPGLVGTFTAAPAGSSQVADMVLALLEARVLRAVSVGFKFLATRDIKDPAERQKIGLGPFGVLGTKQLLYECSIVSIPMNPDIVGRHFDEALTRGVVTKAAVEATLPGFTHDEVGTPLTERDYAGIIQACAKTFHALGAVQEAEDGLESASELVESFRALASGIEGEPEPADEGTPETEPAQGGDDAKALEESRERIKVLDAQVIELTDLAQRQAEVISNQADAMAEHMRRVEGRSPTQALDDTEELARGVKSLLQRLES